MDGRSRMNKYQDLRKRVAGENEGSTVPRNGTARDNSYNLRHSRGGVSSGDVFNDDTGSLNTRVTRNLTTDYDEMLREQEEFLRSLEEQFDVFRNTGSFSTVREENAEEVQAFDDAIPSDVKLPDEKTVIEETAEAEPETTEEPVEEPVIEEEVTETETVEEETVEETAEIEQPVEKPVIEPEEEVQETVTEEAAEEPEKSVEESSEEEVTEIEPEETEEPEAENVEDEYPQQELEVAEEEPAETVEEFTEEAEVIEEQAEEPEQEPETYDEESYEEDVQEEEQAEEPEEELAEPEVTETVTVEEIQRFFEETDTFDEASDDEETVPSDADFDNRFGLASEHEDFNEILDSLKVEDDVIDNTYMSLDMPWMNKQTNEPFEFFQEKKEEPVHTQKLPRVSSVFGPMDGIKNTGYDDPTYDLNSYNTFVADQTENEEDYKLIEPEEVTEELNENEEEEVEVVKDAYPDLIPQIPNEYTPSEYMEDPIVPSVDETMQSFDEPEDKLIEETIDETELSEFEEFSEGETPSNILNMVIDEPVSETQEERTDVEEVPLAETVDYSEEELSPIIGDYALEFMKQNDIGIPERSEFTDTFADVISSMNAENKTEETVVPAEEATPEIDEEIIQEDNDEEQYRDLLEEASSDFNEDMFFNRKREEPVIIEESQLDMDIQQDPQIETEEPAEAEEPLVEIDEIESEDSQELREGTVEQQQLEIVDEASEEAIQHEEGQDIMDNDQVNYEETNPEQEISFDDMYVEPLDIPIDDYYTEFEYRADVTDELISDAAVDEIMSEPEYEQPAEEIVEAAEEAVETEPEVQENAEEPALEEPVSEEEVSAFDFQPAEEVQEAEPEVTEPEEYSEQPAEAEEESAEEPAEQPEEFAEEPSEVEEPVEEPVEQPEEFVEQLKDFTEEPIEQPVQETEFEGIPDVEEEFVEPFVEYAEPQQFAQEEPAEFTEPVAEQQPEEEPVEYTEPAEEMQEEPAEFTEPVEEAAESMETVEEIQEEPAEYAEPVEETQEEPMEYVEPAEEAKEEHVEEKAEEPIFSFDFNEQPEEPAEEKVDLPFENAAVKKPQYDLGVNVRPFNIERTTLQPAETKSSDVPEYDFSIDDELNDMEDMFSSEPLEDSYNDVEKILRDVKAYNIAHGIRNAEDTQVNIMTELRQQEAKEAETAKAVEEKKPARGGIFAGFFNASENDDDGYEADNPVSEPDLPVFEFTDFEEPEEEKEFKVEEPEFKIEEPVFEVEKPAREIEQPFMKVEEPVRESEIKTEEPVKEVEKSVEEAEFKTEEPEVSIEEPVQRAEDVSDSVSTTLTDLSFNEEYALDEDDSFYELDSTPVVAPTMAPEYQPQLQKQESDSTRENREHLNELTQKIEMERELRQEMFEQTQQLKLQVSEYENELNDVNNNVSRTNRILNVVLTLLIIALFVIIVIIGFFFAQERGLI